MKTSRPIKELVFSLLLTAAGGFMLHEEALVWGAWITIIFFGLCSIVLGYAVISGRPPHIGRVDNPSAIVKGNLIEISSYPYRHSSLYGRPNQIPPDRISCVFNTISVVALVLDGKEVIFLPAEQKEAFDDFVKRHHIKDHRLEEVWMLLSDPYLDQEYTKENEARDDRRLAALGVLPDEIRRLRKEIGDTMLRRTMHTWEWGLYSTQDVLRTFALLSPRRFTQAFYWHVMEVALRPYPLNCDPGANKALQPTASGGG